MDDAGTAVACLDGGSPSEETCNDVDDDCNGAVDEGYPCNYEGLEAGVCPTERDNSGNCPEPNAYG